MKKFGCLGIVLIAVIIAALWGWSKYNGLVTEDEKVNNAWADVQTQYQRRADLIPNLVETVKGYAEHESETLQKVIEARAKATSINVDPNNLTEEALQQYQQAQGELGNALGRLLVSIERYPDLKANQNFLELQSQLEGTENRINNARDKFNTAAKEFNTMVRKFPANIVASLFGFKNKTYFAASETAQEAPKVQF
ncbi:MAG: LemA family protein [Bacteroidales bacterium]|jgi:LemA protein|nr:LemA family protein [Bacteroidales bacterium]MBQ2483375.1 LemA family protein [Bacteroidales bacterium]MBQ2492867.1 LemA family protein [Bacteroidales bacterium]MBQ4197544.1 LemA family protein [Bacteroidales bacterium]